MIPQSLIIFLILKKLKNGLFKRPSSREITWASIPLSFAALIKSKAIRPHPALTFKSLIKKHIFIAIFLTFLHEKKTKFKNRRRGRAVPP